MKHLQVTDRDPLLATFAFVGSGLILGYWAFFLSGVLDVAEGSAVIHAFESAFPIADALMAGFLVAAGIGLLRGRAFGRFAMTVGASMVLYLGILDLTFYLRQGFLAHDSLGARIQLTVTLICVVGGAFGVLRSRRQGSTS